MAESEHREAKLRNRVVDSISRRAENALKEDYGKARVMASDAVQSQAYLYPIKGIFYFLAHRSLWQPLIDRIVPYGTLTISVIAAMFTIAYLPQLAVLLLFNGPLAVYSTVLLTLNESSIIIHMISRTWILQEALMDTFDGTMVSRNATAVVQQGREVRPGSDPMKKLGKVNTEAGSYTVGFGVVATLLEMIPVVSIFFSYTNTVGAALWAADIEMQNNAMVKETAPNLRQAAESVE
ncbi:hypothetical protein TrVFT333_004427 [Trichoderma virens FT-333]|nr:hypothetical protein TrVFT333_004427 [Trichoderma virens FT-333]